MRTIFNIDDAAKVVNPIRFDSKLANTYVDEANIIIETIPEYLTRVTLNVRVPGVPVTILTPKSGYTSLGTYPIYDYGTIIINFVPIDYTFIDGIQDINFVPVNYGYTYVAYASGNTGAGFSLVNDPLLEYTAILTSPSRIDNLTVNNFNGLWRRNIYTLSVATSTTLGGVTIGDNVTINNGAISVKNTYLELDDTVDETYIDKVWFVPKVNDIEEDLELVATEELLTEVAVTTLLADMPSTLVGFAGYSIRVNSQETGWEFYLP